MADPRSTGGEQNNNAYGGLPVQLSRNQYYEETGTLPERLFIVALGFLLSPLLVPVFHVIASFTVTWLWTITIVGIIGFCIFHILDVVVYLTNQFFHNLGGGGGGNGTGGDDVQ